MIAFHSFWTLSLLILFIGIIVWAWSSKRREDFEQSARLPLDDDLPEEKGPPHG